MFGGAGIDTIHGDAGDDYMEGNIGADTMYGGEGEDDMIGGSSDLTVSDQAYRSDGNDWMDGGAGHDVLLGDNGRISRRIDVGTNEFMRYTLANNGVGTGLGLENNAVIRDIVLVDLDDIGEKDVMHVAR
jgi:Ca2+-binding RTX toxin-like protein